MKFRPHLELEGKHSFLSASKYHWINYSEEKLDATYRRALLTQRGTELHEFAKEAIRLGIKLPRSQKTINMYVNDAIGFRMQPEVVLFYSYNAFCTADAISFRRNLLRIHDLKTGETKTSMNQLKVYAAMFCLEYEFKPSDIEMELRIYQNDEVLELVPDVDDILHIMDRIVTFDKRIDQIRMEDSL